MTSSPKRVLVVDNDPDVLDSVEYSLAVNGYQVYTANSPEMAQEVLDREIIHLAIIDLRLRYEDRVEDLSGFDVALKLPAYIPCMIFTAYENIQNVKRALGEVKAKKVLPKQDSDAAVRLIKYVDELFATEVKVNLDLKIEGPCHPEVIAACLEAPATNPACEPSAEDVQQILQMLFPDADCVEISGLRATDLPERLARANSVLLRARPHYKHGWGAPVVVKLSSAREIDREARNYKLISPFLGGHRRAELGNVAYSRQVGGLVYSLLDEQDSGGTRLLGDIFFDLETDTVVTVIRQFFKQTFKGLFDGARTAHIDLMASYTPELGMTPEKLRKALEAFHPQALTGEHLCFEGVPGFFKNPISWALQDTKFRSYEVDSRQCLCHGDLHSRNILVDRAGRFWLIDFARVAESHILRDLVELETDIKFNLLPVSDLAVLLPFERAVVGLSDGRAPLAPSFGSRHLDHAFQAVLALRTSAAELLGPGNDMREYDAALLIHTLNILRLRHIRPESKEYALLSAALLCERL